MEKQKRFILPENEIPTQWYNIVADMKTKPLPMLNPQTKKPITVDEMSGLFNRACSEQELNQTDAWFDIPEQVRDLYKSYRSTPLVRAYGLEKALDTPAHIYFKNESVSPVGSHKLNSALAQAYYCKQEGVTNITTETGAGQWGAALSYAAKAFGLELAVFMVKVSYNQKPYRRSIMQTFGAQVIASPSMSTKAGRKIITENPNYQGSLGTAISEAVELAMQVPNCKYVLGSVLNHVTLHQTVIGLEAEKQMAMAGEYPDMVIACFGGGSNFGGLSFPFMRHNLVDGKKTVFLAAEPASCPKLTRGVFQYDFGDEAGYTPMLPM
ncbi:MAG: TrpB-like pyridoxal phosphate-dependent enzyme, partial [Bacteroidales bacterium]|nr:TrpB-like pyridoxal phosphate-dependent enzyme [Bacteroidales bacterium]